MMSASAAWKFVSSVEAPVDATGARVRKDEVGDEIALYAVIPLAGEGVKL
jgi:hypothetical protein